MGSGAGVRTLGPLRPTQQRPSQLCCSTAVQKRDWVPGRSRCLSAYQYRCCSAARAASPPPAPAGCPKAIHSGRRACAKFEKSATHKAVATRRFGVHLSRSAK
eukprot:EG_transcript_61724